MSFSHWLVSVPNSEGSEDRTLSYIASATSGKLKGCVGECPAAHVWDDVAVATAVASVTGASALAAAPPQRLAGSRFPRT